MYKPKMPPPPPTNPNNRDSNGIRASIFDVCYQLGALDDNSLIAEWMFNDPLSPRRPARRFPGTTRFQEVLTPVEEDEDSCEADDDEAQTHRRFPFSLFGPRSRSRSRSRSKPAPTASPPSPDDDEDDDDGSEEAIRSPETGGVDGQQQQQQQSPTRERGSFFRRSVRRGGKSEMIDRRSRRSSRTASTRYDSGYASMKSRSLLRKLPGSETRMSAGDPGGEVSAPPLSSIRGSTSRTPPELVQNGDSGEWEKVEAMPNSPKYALINKNKGINPSPVHPRSDQDAHEKRNAHHSILPSFPRFAFRSSTPVPLSPSTGSAAPKQTPSKLSRFSRSSTPSSSSSSSSSPHPLVKGLSSKQPSARDGTTPSAAPIAARFRHRHKRSASLPTPPFLVPFSSSSPSDESSGSNANGNAAAPRQASRVMFADDAAVPSSRGGSAGQTYRASMGYHNQFFVRPATFSSGNGKAEGEGSGLVKGKERMMPFLGMKVYFSRYLSFLLHD